MRKDTIINADLITGQPQMSDRPIPHTLPSLMSYVCAKPPKKPLKPLDEAGKPRVKKLTVKNLKKYKMNRTLHLEDTNTSARAWIDKIDASLTYVRPPLTAKEPSLPVCLTNTETEE